MKPGLIVAIGLFGGTALYAGDPEFHSPVRLKVDGVPIRVESPGYAAPAWADIDGSGKKALLVGQFNGGKIQVFKNLGDGKFAAGAWLQADGKTAEVPGVW
jgi:hypothetical protein